MIHAATPATDQRHSETHICVAGEMFTALPEGALWWDQRRILVVSDLHLEKGSSYAAQGQMLPPYDSSATLSVVEALVQRLGPKTVISLGDSFHDRRSEARLSPQDACRIRALTSATEWFWVEGNHDPIPPARLGGRGAHVLEFGRVFFRHDPTGSVGEIAGHLHPCAKVRLRGHSVRTKCFAADGSRLILPALGAFTGGLNVKDPAFNVVFPTGLSAFAINGERVFTLSQKSLIPDGPRQGTRWRL